MSATATRRARLVVVAVGLAIFAMLGSGASAQTRNLGRAQSFAVLAAATVTNTGPTEVRGDLGVFPLTAVTGFPPGTVFGEIHQGDAVAGGAQEDARATYTTLAGLPCTATLTGIVGDLTLTPGVYCFTSDVVFTGTLTLNFQGNADAEFVFKVGTQLTTMSGAQVAIINAPDPDLAACNVFWQVGSSAVLGTNSVFVGTIIADQSITAASGARITGRLLALEAQVSLASNIVTNPCPTFVPPTTTSSTSTTLVPPTTTSSTTTSSTSTTLVPPPTTTSSTTTSSTSTTLVPPPTTTSSTSTTLVAPTTTRPSTTTTRPPTTTTSTTLPVPPVTSTTSTLAPITTTSVPSPGITTPDDGGAGTATTAGPSDRTIRGASNVLGSRKLPATGSPVQWEAFAGGLAVALGGLILLATRRRRESAAGPAPPAGHR